MQVVLEMQPQQGKFSKTNLQFWLLTPKELTILLRRLCRFRKKRSFRIFPLLKMVKKCSVGFGSRPPKTTPGSKRVSVTSHLLPLDVVCRPNTVTIWYFPFKVVWRGCWDWKTWKLHWNPRVLIPGWDRVHLHHIRQNIGKLMESLQEQSLLGWSW